MMDGISGIELCAKVRDKVDCSIIFVTAKANLVDKMVGFEIGGDDYITSGTLRFIIGKIYREIQKHRWRIIGQKFNALMENKVTQILQRPSEFSQVKSIEITRFYPQPEQNLLSIEIEVYTRELLKNNITLDVTINYKKD